MLNTTNDLCVSNSMVRIRVYQTCYEGSIPFSRLSNRFHCISTLKTNEPGHKSWFFVFMIFVCKYNNKCMYTHIIMPQTTLRLRYINTTDSSSYLEIKDIIGWRVGDRVYLDGLEATKLSFKLLYWQTTETHWKMDLENLRLYAIEPGDREKPISTIVVDNVIEYDSIPLRFVDQITKGKRQCYLVHEGVISEMS